MVQFNHENDPALPDITALWFFTGGLVGYLLGRIIGFLIGNDQLGGYGMIIGAVLVPIVVEFYQGW